MGAMRTGCYGASMFTGLITDIGEVRSVDLSGDVRFVIRTCYEMGAVDIGASIAHSGACLTVVEKGEDWYAVDVSQETLDCTTLGAWKPGWRINLEQSLRLGAELGGHLVQGHVDGVAVVTSRQPDGDSIRLSFEAPDGLARYIARKGSVALDGISLTVNEVEGCAFGVNIIPHTAKHTTLGTTQCGDKVNLEVDLLARYVARLQNEPTCGP
jgi:riboflavin synthase